MTIKVSYEIPSVIISLNVTALQCFRVCGWFPEPQDILQKNDFDNRW